MAHNQSETQRIMIEALSFLEESRKDEFLCAEIDIAMASLYSPKLGLRQAIDTLMRIYNNPNKDNADEKRGGYQLEAVTILAFEGLAGAVARSYQSSTAQFDVLVGGNGICWNFICKYLIRKDGCSIIVECKARKDKVSDATFRQMCSDLSRMHTAFMGAFVSLEGAADFPKDGADHRQKKLAGARLRQVIEYKATGKPVVVIDKQDLGELLKPGGLLLLLRTKIRDVDELSGREEAMRLAYSEASDIPAHLKAIIEEAQEAARAEMNEVAKPHVVATAEPAGTESSRSPKTN